MHALVVIPTYNEVTSLQRVVAGALSADAELHVLVVDDASPDGTGELADRLAREDDRVAVLHRDAKGGLGSAYRAGFAYGLQRDYTVLCEMDADASHDPGDLPRLLSATSFADVVIGSRYVADGEVRDWPWHRLALSRGGNRYVQAVTGIPLSDATSGFRAYRREVLEEIDVATLRSDGYSFQLETALRAWRLGFRLAELPITFSERRDGASKISRAIVLEALWRVLAWGLQSPRATPAPHPRSVACLL